MEKRNLDYRVDAKGHFNKMEGRVLFSSFALTIERNGEHVADVQMRHYTKPADFYSPFFIHVMKRGEGIGRDIVMNINDFLRERNAIGVLQDIIESDDDNVREAYGMYDRHGWKPLFPELEGDAMRGSYRFFSESLESQELEDLRNAIKTIP